MARMLLLVVGLLGMASAQFGSEASDKRVRPISKVINLLKDMLTQLDKEQEEDEKIYDAFACWCETNDKAKTKAIADAEQHIAELTSLIESLTSKSAQLKIDIKSTQEMIAKNDKALEEATAVRDKELAEFNEEEKNALMTITGLKGAVVTLAKHNSAAALPQETLLQIQQNLSKHLSHAQLRRLGLGVHQKHLVLSLLQQPTGATSYNSQSGEIFGVLKQMKEDFETNLKNSKTEEAENSKAYAELKSAKEAELAADTKQERAKSVELSKTDEENENSKIDLKDTTAQLEADRVFLADLKDRCSSLDAEWAARQKMRQDETQAVSEALAILSDDDARDLASRSTFVQTSSENQHKRAARIAAAQLLNEASQKLGDPQLSLLAAAVKEDVFAKIKESVDAMVVQLKQEAQDEIKHRDWCIDEYHQNDLSNDERYDAKANQEQKKADLEALIKTLTEEIKAAQAEVAETQIEMKKSGENRKAESEEFATTIADQHATQQLLNKALDKLKGFYDRKALLQLGAKQAPPPGFKAYEKQGGSGGVMGMIQSIIDESRAVETEAISNDHDSQGAHEEFMKDSNKSIQALNKSITDKTEERSQSDAELARTNADLEQTLRDLDALHQYRNELDNSCDFVMKNFESRQKARSNEIDALNEAKAMMSQ